MSTPTAEAVSDPARGERAVAAISVRDVGKVFNASRRGELVALEGIGLDIAAGEFVSLIGPSGCGKSTLLRLVADLETPTTGTVEVNGKPARRARLDHDYGMAFQQAGLFDWRTVGANVELPLELLGWDAGRRRERSRELLDLVHLGDFGSRRPWELSGGMQQRVAIARALAMRPGILLMDEPFGALDEMTREHMQAELVRICADTGATVLFVTHSIPEAVFLSRRVVVMSARPGRVTHIVDVDLGERTEQTRADERFFAAVTEVRAALRGPAATLSDPGTAAVE